MWLVVAKDTISGLADSVECGHATTVDMPRQNPVNDMLFRLSYQAFFMTMQHISHWVPEMLYGVQR